MGTINIENVLIKTLWVIFSSRNVNINCWDANSVDSIYWDWFSLVYLALLNHKLSISYFTRHTTVLLLLFLLRWRKETD